MAHLSRVALFLLALTTLVTGELLPQNSKENADFKLAVNLYSDGLYDLAAEQLRQFIAAYPGTSQGIEARFTLGLAQMKLTLYDEARTTFQTFALSYQDNPKAPEAWMKVGECYGAVRNHREAALAYERVKVFHPKSPLAPVALAEAGREFTLAGQPDDARRVLRIVLQEYGSSSAALPARTRLAELYLAEGNLAQAQNELRRVIDGDPSPDARAQALLVLGNIAQRMGKSDQARKHYQEVLTRHATTSAAQAAALNLGKLESAQGRPTEAVGYLRRALEGTGPTDSSLIREALVAAGDALATLKDYSGAVKYYNLYFAAFPGDTLYPVILWRSALVNSRARNYRRSGELCTQLLAAPASALLHRRAQIRLARNAEAEKQEGRAAQLYETFAERFPDDPSVPDALMRSAALTREILRDPARAARMYDLVGARFPRSHLADDALAAAAACEEDLRNTDRALQLHRRLVLRYPASPAAVTSEHRIRMIEIFEAKDKDAGLEKLALLLGDVVAERDKQGLAYRLGEVYFTDLKNYAAAASQFTAAIGSGLKDDRFVNALYLRARSYEFLALKDPSFRTQAIESYGTFLSSYASDHRAGSALVSLTGLRSTDPASARAVAEEALASASDAGTADTIRFILADRLQAADSTAEALAVYDDLLRSSPGPSLTAEARYRRFMLLTANGPRDSVMEAGAVCLAAEETGRHTAMILEILADSAARTGSYEQARNFYARLANEFWYTPAGARSRERLAAATAAAGDHAAAAGLYRELLDEQDADPFREDGPESGVALALADALRASGQPAAAKEQLLLLLAREPSGPAAGRAYSLLGMIAQSEGDTDLAASYFRLSGTAAPDAPPSRDVADLLYANGSYGEALQQYRALAASGPGPEDRRSIDARVILCRLRNNDLSGIDRDIEAFADRYTEVEEDLAAFELEKGLVAYRREEYAAARKSFDRVADKYDNTPSAPAALYWTGKVLESGNKPQEALKQYERVLRDYPRSSIIPRVHLALGNIYYNVEKWDNSVQHYRTVVDDPHPDPEILPYAMSNLINTYETAGVYDAALALTRKYLELYPNSDDSFDKKVKIGILYQRLGYYDQSVLHLQALLDQAGSDLEGEIRYYIAEANYAKGDYQQAILDFLKVPYLVVKKGKIDWTANALYMSGQSYEKMGRHDQALTMYQQILDRSGIDETFKAAARKEIDRVRTVLKNTPR